MKIKSVQMVASAALSIALLAGCSGKAIDGKPIAAHQPKPDVSHLATGAYPKQPRKLGNVSSVDEGRLVEGVRMSDALPDLAAIDSSLVYPYIWQPEGSTDITSRNMSYTNDPIAQPVLDKYGMVVAYLASSSDSPDLKVDGGSPRQDYRVMFVTLVRFPDAKSAAAAAREMDEVDYSVSPDNVRVSITKYPEAHGHWRQYSPTMAVTLAHGDFVIHVLIGNPTTNYGVLTGLIEKTFDSTVPKIDSFKATPMQDLGRIPRDPDKLLGRTQYEPGSEGEPEIAPGFLVLGPNVAKQAQDPGERNANVFGKAGIDRIAFSSDNGSYVFRARDAKGASTYVNESIKSRTDIDHPIAAPVSVAGSKCVEAKPAVWADDPNKRYACYVTYDRFVGVVYGGDEADVKLRAAAQYALLVNDL
ncbi:hypothetical protein [Smaragdicoccus niigatensis]|uniref:DUF7373 family lipoprotein n=1 Tax=Smaragdicoccus niigatensis TaxID=359359 RepID=UPI0012DE8C41|nr:hypothetical protein [Smaragdicoccus niigatensis]